ncbi:MAG: alpha/beta hydrolase-fold protein [Candidatus Sericytochromatia bacterium]
MNNINPPISNNQPIILRGLNNIQKKSFEIPSNTNTFANEDMFSVSKTLKANPKILNNIYGKKLELPQIPTTQISTNNYFNSDISIKTQNALNQIEGTKWAGRLASNGGREVAIILPKNYDPAKPTEVIYHFHGHGGTIANVLTGSNGLKNQIEQVSKDRNIVVIVPRGPSKENDHDWMNKAKGEDMRKFQEETLSLIKTQLEPNINISSITVEGHSAGGLPIKNAAMEGKLYANKINLMDSSYGDWATSAYKNMMKNHPDTKFNVIYIPNSDTQYDAVQLKNKPNVNMIRTPIGHSNIPKTFFGL